eukprot:12628971-Heterocapsa_arctica.AAC.1
MRRKAMVNAEQQFLIRTNRTKDNKEQCIKKRDLVSAEQKMLLQYKMRTTPNIEAHSDMHIQLGDGPNTTAHTQEEEADINQVAIIVEQKG